MGYDDRRYDDDAAPRRRGADDDMPRSGQPSRPRNSRPRDDRGDLPRTSRPRDDGRGAPPSRSRDDAYDDRGRQSARPSRARDDYGSSTRRRGDDDAGRARRDDDYGSRASSDRRSSRRDDFEASAPGQRAEGSRSGARDFARRMRDRMTGAYEAFSREVRSLGRRDNRSRSRQDDYNRSRDDYPARSSRRDDDADRRAPARNREWIDDPADEASRTPSRGANKDAAGRKAALAAAAAKSARSRSLALQMINRRRKLRVDKISPGARAVTATALTLLAVLIIVGGGLGVGYASALDAYYADKIIALGESRELQSSRIYDRHGTLLYQTFGQQSSTRDYLDFCDIPPLMQQATIDTEDHTFWSNGGIDFNSTLRALSADVFHNSGTGTQGGSTITQQLVKLAVLHDASQDIQRKIDEAILAINLTQHYTKQDIITMYLNIVPYGFIYEGIEAAAENYFHLQPKTVPSKAAQTNPVIRDQETSFIAYYKQCMHDQGLPLPKTITMSGAWQLQPWQAALLAGVPNNPNVYNPWAYPQEALYRLKGGVLIGMQNYGDGEGKYFYKYNADGSKQYLSEDDFYTYVQQTLLQPDPKCVKAHKANCAPANIWANKYQGPAGVGTAQKLAPYFVDYVIQQISAVYPGGEEAFATAGLNVYTTLDYGTPATPQELARIYIDPTTGKLAATNYDAKKEGNWLAGVGLEQYAEYVVQRNITQDFPDYWYCDQVPPSHPDPNIPYGSTDTNPFAAKPWCMETPLDTPYTNVHDGALTAIDPRNGDILAMVGGVDYNGTGDTTLDGGQNNVTISPYRSMGSSFKPIVYSTAMEMGWNPGTVIYDQPTCFPAASSTEAQPYDKVLCPGHYLPHNDENWHWIGPQPLHNLLSNSLNTPAEETLSFVGMRTNADTLNISPLIPMAERLGITSLTPSAMGYSTAIGTQAVPLLQLTSAYGTFANHGYHYPPRAILTIVRADGVVVMKYQTQPQGYQAISAQAAFMVTSMLDDNYSRVADFGIDNPLHFFGRDVAGKTGTSDAQRDIVTMGYTPWLALGVWSGNADSSSMQNIIGIAGAGYIFHDVMAFAIDRYNMPGQLPSRNSPPAPGGYFPVPTGMHLAALNCHTGLAPYKGMNPLNLKQQCDPSVQTRVAPQMTPDFLSPFCGKSYSGPYPPYFPNETLKCSDPGETPQITDGWEPTDWGHDKGGVTVPGLDIAWVMDGQDPDVP
jgi:membrane peptidoglycan carboxypeptidase